MRDNNAALQLQRVIENLPAGFGALREEARAEGYLFAERLAADWEARRMRFDRDGEALLAAHVTGVLAGIGGLTIEPVCPVLCVCGGFTSDRCSGGLALAAPWRRCYSNGRGLPACW
jgi:hypothetical protein